MGAVPTTFLKAEFSEPSTLAMTSIPRPNYNQMGHFFQEEKQEEESVARAPTDDDDLSAPVYQPQSKRRKASKNIVPDQATSSGTLNDAPEQLQSAVVSNQGWAGTLISTYRVSWKCKECDTPNHADRESHICQSCERNQEDSPCRKCKGWFPKGTTHSCPQESTMEAPRPVENVSTTNACPGDALNRSAIVPGGFTYFGDASASAPSEAFSLRNNGFTFGAWPTPQIIKGVRFGEVAALAPSTNSSEAPVTGSNGLTSSSSGIYFGKMAPLASSSNGNFGGAPTTGSEASNGFSFGASPTPQTNGMHFGKVAPLASSTNGSSCEVPITGSEGSNRLTFGAWPTHQTTNGVRFGEVAPVASLTNGSFGKAPITGSEEFVFSSTLVAPNGVSATASESTTASECTASNATNCVVEAGDDGARQEPGRLVDFNVGIWEGNNYCRKRGIIPHFPSDGSFSPPTQGVVQTKARKAKRQYDGNIFTLANSQKKNYDLCNYLNQFCTSQYRQPRHWEVQEFACLVGVKK